MGKIFNFKSDEKFNYYVELNLFKNSDMLSYITTLEINTKVGAHVGYLNNINNIWFFNSNYNLSVDDLYYITKMMKFLNKLGYGRFVWKNKDKTKIIWKKY